MSTDLFDRFNGDVYIQFIFKLRFYQFLCPVIYPQLRKFHWVLSKALEIHSSFILSFIQAVTEWLVRWQTQA